jgi:hypothetical protein
MEYTIDNILKECDTVVYDFQNSTKKRLRPMLDKRNYLIGMLYYKFGYTEEQIATIFNMSRTTVSVSKLHTYSLLKYGDNIFKTNVSEYLINYPYDFPSFSAKFKKDIQIVMSFDTKTLKKIRAYRDVVNEKTTANAIKRLVNNGLQLWEK